MNVAELAEADRTVAAVSAQLTRLRASCDGTLTVDEVARILLDSCTPEILAVGLAVAVHRLNGEDQK